MCVGRTHIAEIEGALATRFDEDALMERRMSWSRHNADALHDLARPADKLDTPERYDGHEVALEVARGSTLVGMRGEIVLAAANDVASVWKRRSDRSGFVDRKSVV